jgi:hypothetical protein
MVLLEEELTSANQQVTELFDHNPRWDRLPEGRVTHARLLDAQHEVPDASGSEERGGVAA